MTTAPRRLVVAATTAAALALASCSSGDTTSAGEDDAERPAITVGLTYTPDVQFAPFYLAESTGAFDRAGIDVTLRHHGANEPLFGALQAGEEDVVFAGGDEMMQARGEGVDVVDFATLYQEYPVALIVPEDSPIQEPADLAGQTVGVPGPYGETWFGLLSLLQGAGVPQDQVDVQHIGFSQQAALLTGSMPAVVGYVNNDAVQVEAAGTAVRTIPVTDPAAPQLVGIGLGASSATIEEDPEALAAIVRALREVMEVQGQDPVAVVRAATEYVPGLADETAAANARTTWEATLPLYGDEPLGTQDMARFTAMSTFLEETGLLATPVPAEEAATTEIVDAID